MNFWDIGIPTFLRIAIPLITLDAQIVLFSTVVSLYYRNGCDLYFEDIVGVV
jgi:hypothetical protein